MSRLFLVRRRGPAGLPFREVTEPLLVIGRSRESGYHVNSAQVSRSHCQIATATGAAVLTDLGSSNGTFVNTSRLNGPRELAHGDLIFLADDAQFEVRIPGAARPAGPPASQSNTGAPTVTLVREDCPNGPESASPKGHVLTIGLDRDCQLHIMSPEVAPVHCAILVEDNHAVIFDMSAIGGASINDVAIANIGTILNNGDVLKIRDVAVYKVQIETA